MKKTLLTLGLLACCLPANAQAPRKDARSARPATERTQSDHAAPQRPSAEPTGLERPAAETVRGSVLDSLTAPPTPAPFSHDPGPVVSGTLSPTPEMWFYSQERMRYESPKSVVRRKAEIRAAERTARIESQRWFGMEKARPLANPTPITGTYSPMWAGNSNDRLVWRGGYAPNYVVLRPAASLY